jgi:hypothetical protein
MTHEEMVENQSIMEGTVTEPSVESVKEYRPSDNEVLRLYPIEIKFLHRGCIVHVGCKSIAFEDHTSAMVAINHYVNNPYEEQIRWSKLLD